MRIGITMLMLCLCNGINAATAYWGGISVIDDGYYQDAIAQYFMGGTVGNNEGNSASVNSFFYGHKENENVYLKHDDFATMQNEPTFTWWALALYGDIVSNATFGSLPHIEDFFSNDPEIWYSGGTKIENPEDFYMAFKMSEVIVDDNYDYVPGQTWYGWVHVSIDENLEMTLLGDGINLDGGAVTVGYGATPEPASGVLLLLGGALLALRRRRRGVTP